jgi:hypothetical protein
MPADSNFAQHAGGSIRLSRLPCLGTKPAQMDIVEVSVLFMDKTIAKEMLS